MSDEEEEPKEVKAKARTSYPRELKAAASLAMKGLVTVQVTFLDGTKFEHQQVATIDECQAAKWFGVLLARPDVRPVPSAEESIRKICEEKGITE